MNYIVEHPDSAFLYFLMLIFSVLFAFIAQRVKSRKVANLFVTFVILILAIPAGLRGDFVGIDTLAYVRGIESANPNYLGEPLYKFFDYGFQLLIKALVFLVGEPHYVLLIISLITVTLIIRTLWFFKDKVSFSLSVFLYFTMHHYFEIYNISRQWLAVAVTFYAVRYLLSSKYITYCCFVFVAATLHASALVCLTFIPLHMLIVKKSPLKYKIMLIIATVTFALFFNSIMDVLGFSSVLEKYQHLYLQDDNKITNFGYLFFVRLLAIITALWFLVSRKYKFEDVNFAKSIITLSFVGTVGAMLGYVYLFADRIAIYATVFEVILFSMLSNSRSFPILIKVALTVLGVYLLYQGLAGSAQGQMPYKLFLMD